jgi:hypothetical protein
MTTFDTTSLGNPRTACSGGLIDFEREVAIHGDRIPVGEDLLSILRTFDTSRRGRLGDVVVVMLGVASTPSRLLATAAST